MSTREQGQHQRDTAIALAVIIGIIVLLVVVFR
jgi:predicted exporter